MLLPFLVLSLLLAGAEQDDEARLVRDWKSAVLAHQPGTVDQPLLDLAALPPSDIDTVRRVLRDALKREPVPVRNDILRRGALAHTDIALLLPDRAGEYLRVTTQKQPVTFEAEVQPKTLQKKGQGAVVVVRDGEFRATAVETAHWSTARGLLSLIVPYPSRDEFVRLWYRAVAAYFEGATSRSGSHRSTRCRPAARRASGELGYWDCWVVTPRPSPSCATSSHR